MGTEGRAYTEEILRHYFRVCYEQAGGKWDPDMDSEIASAVDALCGDLLLEAKRQSLNHDHTPVVTPTSASDVTPNACSAEAKPLEERSDPFADSAELAATGRTGEGASGQAVNPPPSASRSDASGERCTATYASTGEQCKYTVGHEGRHVAVNREASPVFKPEVFWSAVKKDMPEVECDCDCHTHDEDDGNGCGACRRLHAATDVERATEDEEEAHYLISEAQMDSIVDSIAAPLLDDECCAVVHQVLGAAAACGVTLVHHSAARSEATREPLKQAIEHLTGLSYGELRDAFDMLPKSERARWWRVLSIEKFYAPTVTEQVDVGASPVREGERAEDSTANQGSDDEQHAPAPASTYPPAEPPAIRAIRADMETAANDEWRRISTYDLHTVIQYIDKLAARSAGRTAYDDLKWENQKRHGKPPVSPSQERAK